MSVWEAALWGLFGSFAVEGLDLYTCIRRRGIWPWNTLTPSVGSSQPPPAETGKISPWAYAVAESVRMAIGTGMAAVADVSGQLAGPASAMAIGIAAPIIIEKLALTVPLDVAPANPPAPAAPKPTATTVTEGETTSSLPTSPLPHADPPSIGSEDSGPPPRTPAASAGDEHAP